MTQRFINLKNEVSALYCSLLFNKRFTHKEEAARVGMSEAMVSLWCKDEADKALPLSVACSSMVGDELVAFLAQKRGGVFVKLAGKCDGSSADQQRIILQAIAELQVETDPSKRQQLFLTIEQNAALGHKEESK